ncbi:MAG: hypothetical protein FWC93_00980 [Defluviitaleaceae bacterium]|nr:hypothetical protein [Defluviitaleaceae bacterium]
MTTLFFVCMGVGAGFVLLSVVFGQISGMVDINMDAGAGVSPFKPIVLAIFLTVFGGLGLIFAPVFQAWMALSLAALGGLAMAYLLFRYVVMPLHKWQNTSAHEKQSIIGVAAKVSEHIPQGGYGKITYTYNDKILSGPAKSEGGSEIARDTQVEIVYIEKNTYHVRAKI